MRVKIDIVSGFLGSGKTTAINGLISSDVCSKKNILIVLCEDGEAEIAIPSNLNW